MTTAGAAILVLASVLGACGCRREQASSREGDRPISDGKDAEPLVHSDALGTGQARSPGEPPAGAVALASAPPQTVELSLPFDGVWGVLQGTDSQETHHGYAAYALDFVPAEVVATALPLARRKKLADWPCYGQPVLAPADGVVVWARDQSPDPPLNKPIEGDTGNFVIIEHAPQEYTEFRHLQARSVRVKVGDRVVRGQRIAACGNSGNAGVPHLHVGFLGSVDPIATRPVRFSRYQVFNHGTWEKGAGLPTAGQLLRRLPEASPPADAARPPSPGTAPAPGAAPPPPSGGNNFAPTAKPR